VNHALNYAYGNRCRGFECHDFAGSSRERVPKPDGSGRAVGTVLAGPALESIKAGKAHYGEVPILGTPYMTGYEPIKDSSGAQIGVYYVGYKK
jgi:hypothetical protein